MVEQIDTSVVGLGQGRQRLEPDAVTSLVDASPDGVMVVDPHGIVRFANPSAVGIFGRSREVLVGSEFGIPLVALDKVDIDVPRRDGEVGVYELRVTDASWRGRPANLVTVRDVTDRARHEAQVHQLNRELQLRADAAMVLTHVGDGVVLLDEHGIVRMWNPAAERILDHPRSRIIGKSMTAAVPGWAQVERDIPLTEADSGSRPAGHGVVLDVGGEERWLSVTGVRFDGGTVYAFHDLTDETRVATLKRDFIDTASHELRTPLTSIYGAAHTLRRPDLDLDGAVREELVEVIWTQAQRLQRITESILATRKLDHDTLDIQAARFDAVQLAEDVVAAAREHARDDIGFSVLDELGLDRFAVADEDKLRQVLGNVVQNAIKYSPGGGGVRVRVTHGHASIKYEVADDGIGIANCDLDRVFEKFYRASGHEGRSIEGTGLGLYIARELARRMGGDLWVRSRLGVGSVFTLRVPRPSAEDDEGR